MALLLLVLVACGGGASAPPAPPAPATPEPKSPPAAPPAAVVTPSPEIPVPPARCPEVPLPTGTSCYTVTIRDFAFDPSFLRIPTLARLVFVNEDAAAHSISWSDGAATSPVLASGESTQREFRGDDTVTLEFRCGIHPAMRGTIVLDASLPVP